MTTSPLTPSFAARAVSFAASCVITLVIATGVSTLQLTPVTPQTVAAQAAAHTAA
jgi:hypothetical protein